MTQSGMFIENWMYTKSKDSVDLRILRQVTKVRVVGDIWGSGIKEDLDVF